VGPSSGGREAAHEALTHLGSAASLVRDACRQHQPHLLLQISRALAGTDELTPRGVEAGPCGIHGIMPFLPTLRSAQRAELAKDALYAIAYRVVLQGDCS
jgi:hypothetical protein